MLNKQIYFEGSSTDIQPQAYYSSHLLQITVWQLKKLHNFCVNNCTYYRVMVVYYNCYVNLHECSQSLLGPYMNSLLQTIMVNWFPLWQPYTMSKSYQLHVLLLRQLLCIPSPICMHDAVPFVTTNINAQWTRWNCSIALMNVPHMARLAPSLSQDYNIYCAAH